MTLAELRRRGVVLSLDGGGLIVRAPRGVLTDEDRTALRAAKLELGQALAQEAVEAAFGPCEMTEVLPRNVADIRWTMLHEALEASPCTRPGRMVRVGEVPYGPARPNLTIVLETSSVGGGFELARGVPKPPAVPVPALIRR